MTQFTKISPADLENVNAYLDGALSPKEKADFEIQLAKSLPLQNTLREYTILRNTLRSLPPKKAPHHFTLTTAEAQEARLKPKLFLAPIFSFASLVTVMLLAIVFTSDWIFKNMSAPAAPVAVQAPMIAAMTEPAQDATAAKSSAEAPLIFNWASGSFGAYGLGGGSAMPMGGSAEGGMGQAFDSRVVNPGTVTEEVPSEMTLEMVPPDQPVEQPAEQLNPQPAEEPAPVPITTFMVPADYAGAVIWGLQPDCEGEILEVYPTVTTEPQLQANTNQIDAETQSREVEQPASKPYQTAAWIKYSLAGLALLFGLLAYFFQRRMS